MLSRDYRDITGGVILMLIGVAAAWHAWSAYPLGTLRRMGPGLFPTSLGVVLFVLGLAIAAPALWRTGPGMPAIEWRSLVLIPLAGLFFAATIERLGIIPSVFGLVVIASRADDKLGASATAIYASCLAAGSWLIFVFALSLPLQAARWPF